MASGVDARMGCVWDIRQPAFKTYWVKRLEEDPDIDPIMACSVTCWRKRESHPKYQGSCGGWLNWTVPDLDCDLPIFASRLGTDTIPSTSAMTQGRSLRRVCALHRH